MKEFHKRRIHKRREHVQWRNFSPEKETITARSISRDYWITSNRAKFPRRMSSSNHLLWRNFSPKKALRKDRSIFDAKNWSCHRRYIPAGATGWINTRNDSIVTNQMGAFGWIFCCWSSLELHVCTCRYACVHIYVLPRSYVLTILTN
jgi:hypothetical protein